MDFLELQRNVWNAPVGEAHSLPLARSALGSLFEGAAEQSEAEGVSYDEWYVLLILHRQL